MKVNSLPRKESQRNIQHDKRYDSPKWRVRRRLCLKEADYKCQCSECKERGLLRFASVADHPIPVSHGGDFWKQKLVAMNLSCHAKKSATERGNIKIDK